MKTCHLSLFWEEKSNDKIAEIRKSSKLLKLYILKLLPFPTGIDEKETINMSTYPLRLADHVMEEAKQAAAEDNVSLNQLLSAFIADGIGHRRAILSLQKRAARSTVDAALSILDRAPDVEPDPVDELAEAKRTPAGL